MVVVTREEKRERVDACCGLAAVGPWQVVVVGGGGVVVGVL